MIKVKSLSKTFGKKEVLKGINLAFGKGEIHGIVGKNGSGKTTLFRSIIGLEKSEGSIESLFEHPLKNITGFLPTSPPIISKITTVEYLQLICNARGITFDRNGFENIFELPLDQYIETFSTGMTKKLALHGALLQKNEVFILDEPYNGLDYQSCLLVTEILKRIKEKGKTVIISSHIFSTLRDTCDYIHYLENGTINSTADRDHFDQIEKQLQQELIGDKIDHLIF
ncbi:MAG: ATP-binding cassette domain-containing protein [Ekhidna sp.]